MVFYRVARSQSGEWPTKESVTPTGHPMPCGFREFQQEPQKLC
jgi:hypothetical protein